MCKIRIFDQDHNPRPILINFYSSLDPEIESDISSSTSIKQMMSIFNECLKEYNGFLIEEYIEFDSEEDANVFRLKWG